VAALPESFGGGFAFGPTVDGLALTDRPLELVRAGLASTVPLIVGVTADEFTTMIQNYAPGPIETAEDMRAVLEARHGAAAAAAILAVYPPESYPTPRDALIAFFSDVAFVCPSRRFARAAAEHAPVRRFVWSHTYDSGPIAAMRAGHGLDLPFVFRNFFHHEPSARELALAGAIAGAWGRFAAGGDPGPVGGVDWPAAGDDSHLVLAPELSLSSGFRQAQCDHWDRVMDRP
jgi:para-nitrobenzyl esterase